MKCLAGILLLLAAVFSLHAAPPKGERIAVVNMETVFRQYFKSRIAADTLRQQSEVYRTYIMAEQDKIREVEKEIFCPGCLPEFSVVCHGTGRQKADF